MATGSQNLDVLRSMILTFRTYELQLLLGKSHLPKWPVKACLPSKFTNEIIRTLKF